MVGCFWRIAASISKHCAGVTPAAKARRAAPWMVGPSASGSEKGIPSSRASAPPSISASIIFSDCSGPGSPRVTKGTKAPSGDFSVGQTASHSVPSDFPSRFQDVMYGENVFVAAAGEINHQQLLFFRVLAHHLQRVGQSVRGLQRRDNPFVAESALNASSASSSVIDT